MASNNFLDPEMIKLVVEVAAPLMEKLIKQIQESQSKITEILKKIDQLVLREINSGFENIREADLTDDPEIKKRLLAFAEEQLLKNTGLNLELKIGDHYSSYWVGLCHFGLFTIGKLRGEHRLAARYVMKAFVADPRTARETHFPNVYEKVFVPRCVDVKAWHEQEIRKADNNNFEAQIIKEKLLVVGTGLLSGGSIVMGILGRNGRAIAMGAKGFSETAKEWEKVTPEKCRREAKVKLMIEYEKKLDIKCKSIANELLA